MMATLFYFILALILLISVHEFGHFSVARLCGVKVLRFSLGFGKILARWQDKRGTEYVISAFPLGGYIKMLDETEAKVAPEEKHLAFNNKSVYARIAIVLAGPLFNFLFAIVAFWLALMIGTLALAPIIDGVKPNSIAAHAGFSAREEILSLDQQDIHSWQDFQYALIPQLGSSDAVSVRVKSIDTQHEKLLHLSLEHWNPEANVDPIENLGFIPFIPKLTPVVGEVLADSVAKKAGFLPQDRIVSINQQPINDWLQVVDFVKQHPHTELHIQIKRQQKPLTIVLTPAVKNVDGKQEGFLGLQSQPMNWPKQWIRYERHNPFDAMGIAIHQTVDLSLTTFKMIARLVTGKLGLNNLSGPIGIAQGAGNSARMGLTAYLSFLALISISLGVLNLLPIPVLDGGHLFFCLIEVITRRPVSDKLKAMGHYMGFVLIIMLMFIAVFNDFSQLLRYTLRD